MTPSERTELENSIRLMVGKRYVYSGDGCNDVVTVCHVGFSGDIVVIDTDCWNEQFDITSFPEWQKWFNPTRRKSQTVEKLNGEIDRLEGLLAITELSNEEKDNQIKQLEKELTNKPISALPCESQKPVETRPKYESVFPRLFDLLFSISAKVENGQLQISQSTEIREICRDIAEISEIQHRAISMTKKSPYNNYPKSKRAIRL